MGKDVFYMESGKDEKKAPVVGCRQGKKREMKFATSLYHASGERQSLRRAVKATTHSVR